MRIAHLSDLHLGKRVNGFPMLEDQKYILDQILEKMKEKNVDAALIAGDIYDKPLPPGEAVRLFDEFLTGMAESGIRVMLVSGNHDSPERLAFGHRLLERGGVSVSPIFDGSVEMVSLEDGFGELRVYLLPYLKPVQVRKVFPEAEIESYDDGIRFVVDRLEPDLSKRNVLVAHQFVTGGVRCESEELSVGGTDNIDAEIFREFDYVALGHLHGAQKIRRETVRYCGTPLKYSFSEANHKKSLTIVEFREKGNVRVETEPLVPLRDLRQIRGNYEELTARDYYINTNTEDYLQITLTDEEEIPEVMGKLRTIYPNIMKIDYENTRTRQRNTVTAQNRVSRKTPLELFCELYQVQNNREIPETYRKFIEKQIEEVWEVNP